MSEILIVDGRADNRSLLIRLLRSAVPSATLHAFASPATALAAVRSGNPDLIVTEYKMSGMNAAEFIRRCRADPNFHGAILVVTAERGRGMLYEALEAGAADFLLSPIDHRELRARVRTALATAATVKRLIAERGALDRRLALQSIRIENELERCVQPYVSLLDGLAFPVVTIGPDGALHLANRAFAELIDQRRQRLHGRSVGDIGSAQALGRHLLRADAKARREARAIVLAASNGDDRGVPQRIHVHAAPVGDSRDGDTVLMLVPAGPADDPDWRPDARDVRGRWG